MGPRLCCTHTHFSLCTHRRSKRSANATITPSPPPLPRRRLARATNELSHVRRAWAELFEAHFAFCGTAFSRSRRAASRTRGRSGGAANVASREAGAGREREGKKQTTEDGERRHRLPGPGSGLCSRRCQRATPTRFYASSAPFSPASSRPFYGPHRRAPQSVFKHTSLYRHHRGLAPPSPASLLFLDEPPHDIVGTVHLRQRS